jgi:hypothetical protein
LAERPLVPPAKYDFPYPGPVEIYQVDRENVWHECSEGGRFKFDRDVAGCQWFRGKTCIIIAAMHSPRAGYKAILRHEMAHCNGWKH